MQRHVVFLSGPIGAGKTTLGHVLAGRLGGSFIDGDDFSDPAGPWYASILRTCRAIVRAGLEGCGVKPLVVVAYPLNCVCWIYFKRKFGDAGVVPLFVSLRASYDNIVNPSRGRIFGDGERQRIRTMVEEGYGERAFSDLIVDTDRLGFEGTVDELHIKLDALIAAVRND